MQNEWTKNINIWATSVVVKSGKGMGGISWQTSVECSSIAPSDSYDNINLGDDGGRVAASGGERMNWIDWVLMKIWTFKHSLGVSGIEN